MNDVAARTKSKGDVVAKTARIMARPFPDPTPDPNPNPNPHPHPNP